MNIRLETESWHMAGSTPCENETKESPQMLLAKRQSGGQQWDQKIQPSFRNGRAGLSKGKACLWTTKDEVMLPLNLYC